VIPSAIFLKGDGSFPKAPEASWRSTGERNLSKETFWKRHIECFESRAPITFKRIKRVPVLRLVCRKLSAGMRIAVSVLNKFSPTGKREWSSTLWVGQEVEGSSRKEILFYQIA
jgi:hypothetical protein